MELKDLMRVKREEKGLTLAQFATKLGTNTKRVTEWELGARFPRNCELEQIISVLEIDASNLERFAAPSYWTEVQEYMRERPHVADKIRRVIELIRRGDINDRGFMRKLDEVLEFKYNKARRTRYASMKHFSPKKSKGLRAWNKAGRPSKPLTLADLQAFSKELKANETDPSHFVVPVHPDAIGTYVALGVQFPEEPDK